MPQVNPGILEWARETSGLSPAKAARAVGIKDARGKTGEERLLALENGEEEPSRSLLVRMAEKYRRPLLVFYLKEPPRPGDKGQDFRVIPGMHPPEYNPELDAFIRDIYVRQNVVKSILEDDDISPLPFIGSANIKQGHTVVANLIEKTISFKLDEFREKKSGKDAFQYLRDRIEASGIFVLLAGNLGSHHTNIPTNIFRGFALADPIAPFVVINDQDAKAAWAFTALHEVAHLWLGTTGVSGASSDARIERFCSDVASAILLPSNELSALTDIAVLPFDEAVERISQFADKRNVTRALIGYKLFRTGLVSETLWHEFREHFYQDWANSRGKRKEKNKDRAGGPSYYVVRRHRLGAALIGLVRRSLDEGLITPTKAGKALGVKARNVEPLLRDIGGGLCSDYSEQYIRWD